MQKSKSKEEDDIIAEKLIDENADVIFENLDDDKLEYFKEAQMKNEVFTFREQDDSGDEDEEEKLEIEREGEIKALKKSNTVS